MRNRVTSLRLVGFAIVAVLVVGYLGVHYVGLETLLRPGYTVHAQFRDSGGIFTGAEVDVRGIEVGTVGDLHVTRTGVQVDLDLDHGVRVPADVHATVTDRSALGEQFVQLVPATDHGPYLHDGSVLTTDRTSIPVPTQTLLAHLDELARSVPKRQLATTLTELGDAFDGAGPDLQRLLDSTSALSGAALADLKNTISLLDDSRTVLDTQVASSSAIALYTAHLASLTGAVRVLDPHLAALFASGVSASAQVTDLLDDTQQALPVLLDNLLTVTDVARSRIPQLRKLLVTFPHALEEGLTLVRYCDAYQRNGNPVPGSCHYDARTGKPDYTAHFGFQLSPNPAVCTTGYGGTTKYLPNGQPVSGTGPAETADTPPNRSAGCTAAPTSSTPNVRGAQNAPTSSDDSAQTAYYDPLSGATVTDSGSYFRVDGSSAPAPSSLDSMLTMGAS